MALLIGVCMLFFMYKVVKNLTHDELVEKDNAKQSYEHDGSGNIFVSFGCDVVGIVHLEFHGMDEEVSFGKHDKVKYYCDNHQKQYRQEPTQQDISFSINVRLINVFPNNFIGFGCFLELDIWFRGADSGWKIFEIMAEISFILKAFLIFCEDFALVSLSVHDDDDFVALNVITANVAFEGGNLCVEFALKFMNFLLNFFKLMLIVLIDCLELLFF